MLMNWKRNWGYLIEKDKVHSRCSGKAACAEKNISKTYGEERAVRVVGTITNAIRDLCEYEEKGPLVSEKFDVITDYRYLFVSKNYVFYRVEDEYIRIINLYHEKEDFMWQLFGIDTTLQETIDYWNE